MMFKNSPRYDTFRREIDSVLRYVKPYASDSVLSGGKKHIRRYHVFTVPKKSGGHRVISAPVRELLELQQELADWLSRYYDPRPCVTGFVKGISVVDNARIHSGRRFVFNADLQDFFPSISMGRVLRTMMEEPFCLDYKQASTLAKICCYLVPHSQQMVLPQGAPTSPVLSNIVCEALDRKLTALSKEYKCRYSRYADDITFSSNKNIFEQDGPFLSSFYEIVRTEGFRINENKTRLQTGSERQEVTGLTTNRFPNVSKAYLRELRMLIHVYRKYGGKDAFQCYCRAHFGKLRNVDRPVPEILHIIQGKLAYLKMVKGRKDSTYIKLRKELYGPGICRADEYKFRLQSYTIEEFEEAFNTTIVIEPKQRGMECRKKTNRYRKYIGNGNGCEDYYAYADIDGRRQFLWFHQVSVFFINENIKQCPDSACLKKNGFIIEHWCKADKTYWLIRTGNEEYERRYRLLSDCYRENNYIDYVRNPFLGFEVKVTHCQFSELSTADLYDILRLRSEVFVVEQNCVYQDLDQLDRTAYHCIARDKFGKIIGACRVFLKDGEHVYIGRVVTSAAVRGKHVGKALMEDAIKLAKSEFGNIPIFIHAQVQAKGFYEKLGFVTKSPEFLEDGIPHVKMIREPLADDLLHTNAEQANKN